MAICLGKQLGKNAKVSVMTKYLHPISIKSYKTMSQIIGQINALLLEWKRKK